MKSRSFKHPNKVLALRPVNATRAGINPKHLCGYTLQPVTSGLQAMLERIESPVASAFAVLMDHQVRPLEEQARLLEGQVRLNPEVMMETIFCFVTPAKELRRLAARETAAFNGVARARYSQLVTNRLPKGRPVIVDAAARETARHREAARVTGREQFNRNTSPQPLCRPATEDPTLREFLETEEERASRTSRCEVQRFLEATP